MAMDVIDECFSTAHTFHIPEEYTSNHRKARTGKILNRTVTDLS